MTDMDREDLDKKLKEDGEKMVSPHHTNFLASRKKLAAIAVVLILGGGAGGYYFGHYLPFKNVSISSEYQFPDGSNDKTKDLPAVRNNAVVQAVKKAGPAVVGITTKVYDRDIFNRRVEVGQSVGSGVIFDQRGYIVTNNHVVEGNQDVNVSLTNGKTVSGKVVGTDPATDLAVIKISPDDKLPVAEFGDSDSLQVGETVAAIGNPLGLEFQGTVTCGVVSALNRTLDDMEQRFKLIQTDAAINPGNSGGALITVDGKVVGINSAKIAKEGVEGMGFAIPINSAKEIIQQLIEHGKVIRAYLGVYAIDKDLAARYGYSWGDHQGVLIMKMPSNGPAAQAGMRPGNYILSIDDQAVNSLQDLRNIIDSHQPGDTISITYDNNGNQKTAKVKLDSAPEVNQ
jgi:serine protease Do